MRNVIGVSGYTGTTEEREAGRVKAWSIAIDAQLAGGDSEVSKSRLTLTLLASGTLPYTPTRVMLNALHIRVLLWEVGNAGFNGFYMFHEVAAKLARWKWNEAKQLHRMMADTKVKQEEELPEYLAALLEQEYDDVLVDSIGQRAYNLAWNLPTSYNTDGSSDGMDNIVDDFAIRSPLDAVAAWYSSLVLQRALSRSLDTKEDDVAAQRSIVEDVTLAIKIAPIGSAAQIRALTGRTVLVKEKRGASIAESLQALGPLERPDKKRDAASSYIHASTSMIGLPDIKMSLRCAMAIAHLERFPSPASPEAAPRIIGTISPVNLTLLGFTAAFKLMEKINGHDIIAISCTGSLEKLACYLGIWISYKGGESGLAQEVKKGLAERCLDISRRIIGREDLGYESMSEDTVN
ncbi:hypothetical protein DL95DRAFT_519967 [Leptodontidium sp. 2 PMI_412]|nr:hypothetical protein DL95DRAFT_519967 [Leptodontidium sp. 2 PMI_412]